MKRKNAVCKPFKALVDLENYYLCQFIPIKKLQLKIMFLCDISLFCRFVKINAFWVLN